MDTAELIRKVRKIGLKTRHLTSELFAGSYHSAFKGKGMAFSEVREYQFGDDVRQIDWNVTARMGKPYLKLFEEERELTVMLLIDVSRSNLFGTQGMMKRDLVAEIAATLAYSANLNNDRTGAILFSDKIEAFIPPGKGSNHILLIVRELLNLKKPSPKTDIGVALKFLNQIQERKSVVFVISDFIDEGFEQILAVTCRKHEVSAIQVSDPAEWEPPGEALFFVTDAETGKQKWIDSMSGGWVDAYRSKRSEAAERLRQVFFRSGADLVQVQTNENYIRPLMSLFRRKEVRR